MKYLTLTLLLFLNLIIAQTGTVNYGEIQSMGMGAPVGADYNALLIFNTDVSLYITRQDSIEGGHINKMGDFGGDDRRFMRTVVTNEIGFQYQNNLKEKEFYSRDLGFRYVKESTPEIEWKITDETKNIGGFDVSKATGKFRGRDYTAWFTTSIPLSYGPWKLQGLPGIILEAYDTNKEIYWYFKSLKYPSEDDKILKPIMPPNNKWISLRELKDARIKKFKNTNAGSKMISENSGIKTSKNNNNMLSSYIEAFEQ